MNFFLPALSTISKINADGIAEWINFPERVQYQVWQDLITAGQHTEYGLQYDFSHIDTIKKYQEQVPVVQYDDIKNHISRMMNGEENVLWNTDVQWFAKSSGTTSDKSKFIPVSEESLHEGHFKASKEVLQIYQATHLDTQLLDGKSLILGGSHQIAKYNNTIQYGDLSAILMQNAPLIGRWIRTPDLSIALLDEWETKIEQLAQSTIKENVTSIAGVPTWTLILIKKILEITNKKYLIDVWPNLEVYLHGWVNFQPYKKNFHQLIGKPIHYLDVYNASEGFFAAQNSFQDDGMLLYTNHGIFYEFMPMEEAGKKFPKTLLLNEIELNTSYAIVITTNGGLWRYLVGDTIAFTSQKPYKIKVTGRLKHFINAFGEEVIVDNTDQAISEACLYTNALITDYTVAPIYFSETNAQGAHEWLIEFEKEPDNFELFVQYLDATLKNKNSDYEAKRHKDIALKMPQVIKCPQGTFNQWLKNKNQLGGQHKIPRLSNNRTYLEEIKMLF